MSAPKNPKRNHHHVWQAYLKPWTIDGKIWCLANEQVALKRTKYVAVDRDFYKLHRLTCEDIDRLKWFVSKGSDGARRTNQHLLDLLMAPYEVAQEFSILRPATEAILERYAYEVLEDYHSSIENSFAPLLEKALRGDISFYTDQHCITFIRYICTQHMRTKGVKERILSTMAEIGGGDFRRIWNIMIFMTATNIGAGMYCERHKRVLQLIQNTTKIPFVTGDQPVVNLKGSYNGIPPTQLSFYYPLSPMLALHWGEVDEPSLHTYVNELQAIELNRRIKKASYLQLFGGTRNAFEF